MCALDDCPNRFESCVRANAFVRKESCRPCPFRLDVDYSCCCSLSIPPKVCVFRSVTSVQAYLHTFTGHRLPLQGVFGPPRRCAEERDGRCLLLGGFGASPCPVCRLRHPFFLRLAIPPQLRTRQATGVPEPAPDAQLATPIQQAAVYVYRSQVGRRHVKQACRAANLVAPAPVVVECTFVGQWRFAFFLPLLFPAETKTFLPHSHATRERCVCMWCACVRAREREKEGRRGLHSSSFAYPSRPCDLPRQRFK